MSSPRPASASAGGKVILLGEHAVVHGAPALALGLQRRVAVRLRPAAHARARPPEDDLLRQALGRACAAFDLPPEVLEVEVAGALPMAVGLGSSAALAVALTRAAAASAGVRLTPERLDAVADEIERLFHGTPSGVDATVAARGGALLFEAGPPRRWQRLRLERSLTFVVALSGERHRTAETVGLLGERVQAFPEVYRPVLDAIGALVRSARPALEKGDWGLLGRLMTMNHGLLRALGVSTPELDRLVERALSAGAHGAKLSGAGGGGAAVVIAGDDPTPVVESLRSAGYECFVDRIEGEGARLA